MQCWQPTLALLKWSWILTNSLFMGCRGLRAGDFLNERVFDELFFLIFQCDEELIELVRCLFIASEAKSRFFHISFQRGYNRAFKKSMYKSSTAFLYFLQQSYSQERIISNRQYEPKPLADKPLAKVRDHAYRCRPFLDRVLLILTT